MSPINLVARARSVSAFVTQRESNQLCYFFRSASSIYGELYTIDGRGRRSYLVYHRRVNGASAVRHVSHCSLTSKDADGV